MATKEFWRGLFADQIRESSKPKILTRNSAYQELIARIDAATDEQVAKLNERRPNAARCVAISMLLHTGRATEASDFDDGFTLPDVSDVKRAIRIGHYAEVAAFVGA